MAAPNKPPNQPALPLDGYERLWSLSEVATYLGVPNSTLYNWRYLGIGPVGSRIGRYVRYEPDEVRAWVRSMANRRAG